MLGSAQKVIVDQQGGAGSGVVPYLPLPELQRRAQQNASPQAAAGTGNATTTDGNQSSNEVRR